MKLFDELCETYELNADSGTQKIRPLIKCGVAYHHAGMLPTLKEVVERLFTTRLIKVIFTTETFALGINMPARTVIFDELRKFYGYAHDYLKTRDFYQMAGRAGRRSIDTEGHVFCRINPHFISADGVEKILYGEPEMVLSKFNAAYATILNLYQKYHEKLYEIYPLSFHHFQERKTARRKAVQILRTKVKILKILGHIKKNSITNKGHFAANVYGYELILAELYDQGFLDSMNADEIGLLCLSLVFEPRKGTRRPKLSHKASQIEQIVTPLANDIIRLEKKFHITPTSKKPFFHLSPPFEAWMSGAHFEEILELTDVDEGEIVRYFRMTIQMLREISETDTNPDFLHKIHSLMDSINRDVIDAEKQLRN
jgi:superfamily II RNA helicase